MELEYVYERRAATLGMPCNFFDVSATVLASLPSRPHLERDYVMRRQAVTELDCSAQMSATAVNTPGVARESRGINHIEGGWDAAVDATDAEQTVRFRQRLARATAVRAAVAECAEVAATCVRQNNAVDIYEEYWRGGDSADDDTAMAEGGLQLGDPPALHVQAVLRDPSPARRAVFGVSWSPSVADRLAVAYSHPPQSLASGGGVIAAASGAANQLQSHVWNVLRPDAPECDLLPKSSLRCLEYSPTARAVIIGGSQSGTLMLFDVRAGAHPTSTSHPEHGHTDAVSAVTWLTAGGGHNCVSVSFDGQACWWDTRKLSKPLDRRPLAASLPSFRPAEATAMSRYASHGVPTTPGLLTTPGPLLSRHQRLDSGDSWDGGSDADSVTSGIDFASPAHPPSSADRAAALRVSQTATPVSRGSPMSSQTPLSGASASASPYLRGRRWRSLTPTPRSASPKPKHPHPPAERLTAGRGGRPASSGRRVGPRRRRHGAQRRAARGSGGGPTVTSMGGDRAPRMRELYVASDGEGGSQSESGSGSGRSSGGGDGSGSGRASTSTDGGDDDEVGSLGSAGGATRRPFIPSPLRASAALRRTALDGGEGADDASFVPSQAGSEGSEGSPGPSPSPPPPPPPDDGFGDGSAPPLPPTEGAHSRSSDDDWDRDDVGPRHTEGKGSDGEPGLDDGASTPAAARPNFRLPPHLRVDMGLTPPAASGRVDHGGGEDGGGASDADASAETLLSTPRTPGFRTQTFRRGATGIGWVAGTPIPGTPSTVASLPDARDGGWGPVPVGPGHPRASLASTGGKVSQQTSRSRGQSHHHHGAGSVAGGSTAQLTIGAACVASVPGREGRLVVGCEGGAILSTSRSSPHSVAGGPSSMPGLAAASTSGLPQTYLGHSGLVTSLHSHPLFPRYILSGGDWTSRVWDTAVPSPVFSPGPSPSMVTCARWSPSRPAVWFTSRYDGTVEAWDLLARPFDSVLECQVSTSPLQCLQVHSSGLQLASGALNGDVAVLSVGSDLAAPKREERTLAGKALAALTAMAKSAAATEQQLELERAEHKARRAAELQWGLDTVSGEWGASRSMSSVPGVAGLTADRRTSSVGGARGFGGLSSMDASELHRRANSGLTRPASSRSSMRQGVGGGDGAGGDSGRGVMTGISDARRRAERLLAPATQARLMAEVERRMRGPADE